VTDALANRGWLAAGLQVAANMPGNFIPSLARHTMQKLDNTVREASGGNDLEREFNQLATQLPLLSAKYPASYDTLGQAVQRYNYGNNSVLNVYFNPAQIKKYKSIPAVDEIMRLYDQTGASTGAPPDIKRNLDIDGKQMQLDNQQIATLQRYIGQNYSTIVAHDLASPVFARLPDELKQKVLAKDLGSVSEAAKRDLFGAKLVTLRPSLTSGVSVGTPDWQSILVQRGAYASPYAWPPLMRLPSGLREPVPAQIVNSPLDLLRRGR
jgi:hypothetical protein